MHGGDPAIVRSFAHYAECDVEGQLRKYDSNHNNLIEYNVGFLTGNDADTPTFHWAQYVGQPTRQDRAESAYLWAGARAAAEAYNVVGDTAKAAEMDQLASHIKDAVLHLLWDDSPAGPPPTLEPQPATRTAGQTGFGNAIPLNGPAPNQFVDMPDGIVNGLTDFTIGVWVNWNGNQDWSRVFDFGTGTTVNMFLTPNAGGAPGARFAITTGGGGAEQQITAVNPLPTGWHHVAVTKAGTVGTLWVDGTAVATNSNITLSPSSMGNTTNNWIGRSQYADPLLNGTVDDFNIFDHALTPAEIQQLIAAPGTANVVSYHFDEAGGAAVTDSSGHGRDATVQTVPRFVGDFPGQVFKHRLTADGQFVQWKDQQNFVPFIEGLVPNGADYRQALRYYGDAAEYPIMPFYTSDQRDKAFAAAVGIPGSNNFSNINATLQAQLYASALRNYPTDFVTPGMYRALLEWLTWVQYIGGDNRLPDNNEFFFNWNPQTQTIGRSGIHHNILGAYNFMIIDDIAGIRPRLDDQLELWPIDVGWNHFAVNNLSYHGHDLTIVWDRPGDGTDHYANAPDGYSAYVDGTRVFTLDRLTHVRWNSRNSTVTILDRSGAKITFKAARQLPRAAAISLAGNPPIVDMFQKAGVDLSPHTSGLPNLAQRKPVTASFTTTSPTLRATSPEFAVDGWTISGLPASGPGGQAQPGYLAPNTIWGACSTARPACGDGSPNAQEWLEIDLGQSQPLDTVKLYFFNDKSFNPQQNVSRDTYRQPAAYTIQTYNGTNWVDAPGQVRTPDAPQANYNLVTFPEVNTQRVRVLMTRTGTFGIGVKEIQIFDTA